MPFGEPGVHSLHYAADLLSILFGQQPEAVRVVGSKENVSLELDRPVAKDDRFAGLLIFAVNKLGFPG